MITCDSKRIPVRFLALGLAVAVSLLSGCSHSLDVKNMSLYKPEFIDSPALNSRLGVSATTNAPEEERLIAAIANQLKKNGFRVTYPYFANEQSKGTVDFVIKISTSSQFKGSGWNFLVNFPGFLVWAPAWHGYNYNAVFGFDIDITDPKGAFSLPRMSVPVDLRFRHAAINRTWTEISWLEFGAIALIGGFVFIRYDNSVTPLLLDYIENRTGDYVASKISSAIISASSSSIPSEAAEVTSMPISMPQAGAIVNQVAEPAPIVAGGDGPTKVEKVGEAAEPRK